MTKGRDLPSYITRRKRDGVLLFRKRDGKRIVEIRLETQFPEGAEVPFALYQERERLLNSPAPVPAGRDMAAVTGQSRRMVEHYTRHVRQRARATEAQRRRKE